MRPLETGDPTQIGSYRLLGRLGAGGMGQVYLGRSPGGRPVAVKLVAASLSHDTAFRRRFAQEVDAARRVGGFHTAQVVDADTEATPPWLVSAYIPGPSLQDAVEAHGPLPLRTVRILGAGLAEGLKAVHDSGLVHRDLKPGNVILASDGPRLIDFGIARAMDAGTLTGTGMVIGSPGFMSPEQAHGGEIGPASDVFSLGSVLVYAATGQGPYGSGSLPMVIYRLTNLPPDLGTLPEPLRGLAAACLAGNPEDRPPVDWVLGRLADAAQAGEHWLPPAVSAMIAERTRQAATGDTAERPPAPVPQAQPGYGLGFTTPVPQAPQGWTAPLPAAAPRRRTGLIAGIAAAGVAVVAAVAVTAVLLSSRGGAAPAPTPTASAPNNAAVIGRWQGSYVCGQGPTALTLTIKASSDPAVLEATFAFAATQANPDVPTGSYAMRGTFTGGRLQLNGNYWIQQPTDYQMVDLSATVEGTAPSNLSGKVDDPSKLCSTWSVSRFTG